MLPSTGYFKGINCPFYDSGLCERPYCHFRHVKKDTLVITSNDGIESGANLPNLVSTTAQKVLHQTELSATASSYTNAVENNVEHTKANPPKPTYNPTPIAELNKINVDEAASQGDCLEQRKRHIPVPYTPRKPVTLPIKRSVENENPSKPFIYIPPPIKYTPGSTDSAQLDPYTPKGSTECTEKYLPGSETELQEYIPKESQSLSNHNYVPSEKSNSKKKKVLEYKPTKVHKKSELPMVTYQPTPKALVPCFSSDEDEPEPKKQKVTNEFNGLDDLGPEFDILDQILDEEKPHDQKVMSIEICENNEGSKSKEQEPIKDSNKKLKNKHSSKVVDKKDNKKEKHKSHEKSNSEKISRGSHKEKDDKSRQETKKSHKSSSKDKQRHEKNEKTNKDKIKSSKSSESKDSKNGISKRSDKHSKHRSSSSHSKHDSKRKEKTEHKHVKQSKEKHKKHKESNSFNNHNSDSDTNNDIMFVNDDEEEIVLSESDEDTIALECKKIFEEYVPLEKNITVDDVCNSNTLAEDSNENDYIPVKKRISRTVDKNIKLVPKAPLKPDYKVSAAQAMAERLTKIKEFHISRNKMEPPTQEDLPSNSELSKRSVNATNSATKIRIAHVPYASTLVNAKKIIVPSPKSRKEEPSTSSTTIQTVKKGTQRVAHLPNDKFIDRPGVLEPLASKIPANIRSTYLNMMIDECIKIYLSAVDAYARAQHEELTTSKKCSAVQIYKNSAMLTVRRLRKEIEECNGVKKSGSDCIALQKVSGAGSSASFGSWSIETKRSVDNSQQFHGARLFSNISKWILTEEQLQDNGFPRPHSSGERGRAIIYGQNKKIPPKGLIRTCCRCKKDYIVDKKGFAAVTEECIYHPNNKYRIRGEVKYQCCSQDSTSDGCCVAPCHVYEYVDFENLKGFIKTMPPDSESDDYGVYSLDCEMCYTTQGLDLTRVTVINSACKVVYETLIKPLHPIIDYNTRYSGITEEHMANVKTTLLEVQATLLSMFSSKTILIGHSLESDFKALKLIHDTVIDTSVLFPHKMGPPFKRALRNLSSEYLKKIIQNSVDGHDSAEDATVCMELLMYKLKEDLKTR